MLLCCGVAVTADKLANLPIWKVAWYGIIDLCIHNEAVICIIDRQIE